MKINQVEELVDITKKNIRFYEDQGLLNPNRNPENGYREYNLNDVEELKKIKLLRKLTVPIDEIKLVQAGKLSISECMEKRIECLGQEQKNIDVMKSLCGSLKEEINDFSQLDASEYLSRMRKMERDGAEFMDIEREDVMKKSKNGAMLATIFACLFIAIVTAGVGILAYKDGAPLAYMVFEIVIGLAVDAGIIVCMKRRMNEIEKGEEYEARKY